MAFRHSFPPLSLDLLSLGPFSTSLQLHHLHVLLLDLFSLSLANDHIALTIYLTYDKVKLIF